jgi:hypothetical protein
MTIPIQQIGRWDYPTNARVTVNGLCIHNRTEEELVEDATGWESWETFCMDCPAWYNPLDDRWVL